MAYIGHSPLREFREFGGATVAAVHDQTFVKSALIALAAAASILALSELGGSAAETTALAKGDRVAAPSAVSATSGAMTVDVAARTTTVERGAATALSPDSPFAGRR